MCSSGRGLSTALLVEPHPLHAVRCCERVAETAVVVYVSLHLRRRPHRRDRQHHPQARRRGQGRARRRVLVLAAAHAVRHLADLAADRDPHVVVCTRERPHAWQLLARHARAVHVEHVLTAVPAADDHPTPGPAAREHPGVTPIRPWTGVAAL